jgi:amidase
MYLARIEAYDQRGPSLNTVLALNPDARDIARALDEERRTRGPRSALHGIPVVLKDNVDTADMPTTAGSVLLEGSIPPDDAFLVRRLRDAGAIILAKVNMSEFASGATMSSVGGWIRNPHDVTRTPSGSSGGTGAAIAASFAQLGIGTDTGGSVRGPSAANGIVGLKPTLGLVSRDGIVPLALSFDTGGPMARNVYDVAAMLGVLAGVDPADPATAASDGQALDDYTAVLDRGALNGARIGVARQFMGGDAEVDWIVEVALETMREAGATIVDVALPEWLVAVKGSWYTTIRWREFRRQIPDYLATLGPEYPKSLADLIERSHDVVSPNRTGGTPNPVRWDLFEDEEAAGSTDDYEYRAMHEHGLALARALVAGLMADGDLDAIVYPTSPSRPARVGADGPVTEVPSATNLANLTGFPDLIVPAGFTTDGLPVAISFFGPAFSEPRLLGLGYAFESLAAARRDPVTTPPLPGEVLPR